VVRDVVIVLGAIAGSLIGLVLVRRRVSLATLQEHHEVAGITYAVLAGLYGVILAFVLVSCWERFDDVRHTIEAEANTLGNIRRHTLAFPEPARSTVEDAVVAYARSVVEQEWPAMEQGQSSPATHAAYVKLWQAVLGIEPGTDKLNVVFQNTLDRMDDMSSARRDRLLYAYTTLPGIVWAFLIGAGALTIAFTYFFGMPSLGSQMIITAALAATICSALILILETQTPFQGALTLPPQPFQFLLQIIHDESAK
jgi:phosphate/sulfate permease